MDALWRQVSFCRDLPNATIAGLAALASLRQCHAHELIQLEGEPANAMYLVASGRIKISRVGLNGREQILHLLGRGEHFNAVAIFDGGPCPANAESVVASEIVVLPREPLLALLDESPALARAMLREFTARLRRLVDLVDTLALHTVQGRLARLLLDQAEQLARGEPPIALTQADMAAHLGTVREMVSRTLKSFEALGLIRLERGSIVVLDRAGLEAQCEL